MFSAVLAVQFARASCAGTLVLFLTTRTITAQTVDHSKEIKDLRKSSFAKYEQHDYAGTIADCNRLIDLEPRAKVYDLRGTAKEYSGDLAGAEADFKLTLELDPDSFLGHLDLGLLKQRKGDADGAAAEYARVIQIDPNYGPAYAYIGDFELDRKEDAKAAADFDHALKLSPENARAWLGLATIHLRQDRMADAKAEADHALELNKGWAWAYEIRGVIKRRQNDPAGSLLDYRRAIELNPKRISTHQKIAYVEARLGQHEAALADAQLSLDGRPSTSTSYVQLLVWSLRTRLGRAAEADRELAAYLAARTPAGSEEWVDHIGASLLGHESEELLFEQASSEDAKKTAGQSCEAWYYAGLKKLFAGDKVAAAERFRQCVATGLDRFYEYELAQAELTTL